MQHFFNQKRQNLLDSTPTTYSFHRRVVPDARGELIQPLPPGRPRDVFTDAGANEQRKKSISKKQQREYDPRWCMRRYQLLTMWNADPATEPQMAEQETAEPKMRSLLRKYKLKEYNPVEREASVRTSAPPKKRKGGDETLSHAGSESPGKKQKLDDAENETLCPVTEQFLAEHMSYVLSTAGTAPPEAKSQESTKLRSKQAPEHRRSPTVEAQQKIDEVLQVVQKLRQQMQGCEGKENVEVTDMMAPPVV